MSPSNTNNGNDTNRLFPVFLKLEELDTLIIGGGNVALEKLNAVISNSPAARITVVSPQVKKEICALARQKDNISVIKRKYHVHDLENKDIVIAATNNKELNSVIKAEAKKKHLLVNVADTPGLCDFYLSSIVQKGNIKLAISTNGKSPTIAKRLKEILNHAIPGEMENVLENLVKIRSSLNGSFPEKVKKLDEITSVLVEKQVKSSRYSFVKIYAAIFTAILIAAFIIYT
jgi:siroheme synthase-like protein